MVTRAAPSSTKKTLISGKHMTAQRGQSHKQEEKRHQGKKMRTANSVVVFSDSASGETSHILLWMHGCVLL